MAMYTPPDIDAKPLRATAKARAQVLEADTEVVVMHRGGPVVKDMWDSQDWEVPPGIHRIPYAVARHLQARAIVPATRNPYNGKAVSQLAILGLDKEAICQPFTDEELKRFNFKEGLDRSVYERPSQRQVEIIDTNDAIAQAYANGVDVDAAVNAEPSEELRQKPQRGRALAEVAETGLDMDSGAGEEDLRPRRRR